MKLAHIAPTYHLKDISSRGDYLFALGHIETPEYWKYFKNRNKKKELLLDNGVFELGHPISDERMLELVRCVKPTYVYAPDHIGYAQQTISAWMKFATRMRKYNEFKNTKILCVAQGRTMSEWIGCVEAYYRDDLCDAIALPYLPIHGYSKDPLGMMVARSEMCARLEIGISLSNRQRWYLTGLALPIEVKFHAHRKWIHGVDSTIAAVAGSQGTCMDDQVGCRKPGGKLWFGAKFNSEQLRCVRHNINVMKEWASCS